MDTGFPVSNLGAHRTKRWVDVIRTDCRTLVRKPNRWDSAAALAVGACDRLLAVRRTGHGWEAF